MKKLALIVFLFVLSTGCEKTKFSGSSEQPAAGGDSGKLSPPEDDASKGKENPPPPAPPPSDKGVATPVDPAKPPPSDDPKQQTAAPGPKPTEPVPPTPNITAAPPVQVGAVDVNVSCEEEVANKGASRSLSTSPSNMSVYVQNVCSDRATVQDDSGKPIDVVFVLDVTGSMETNLSTIKNNIIEFTQALEQRGGNGRFAAVGFRDEGDNFPDSPPATIDDMIGFTSASDFKTKISKWVAKSGSTSPEWGLMGISKGLDLLASDAQSNAARRGAVKAIFYVSDHVAYLRHTLPWDFDRDLDDLLAKIVHVRATSVPALRFYYSASTERGIDYNNDPRFIPAAEQMGRLLTRSQMTGKGYPYPFAKNSFLIDFLNDINRAYVQADTTCYPRFANLYDAKNSVITGVQFASLQGVNSASADGKRTRVNSSAISTSAASFAVNTERCCVIPGKESTCVKSKHASVPFSVGK